MQNEPKDTGLYIHVPWCRRRCPYCDFYLVVGKPDEHFANALENEFLERKKTHHISMAKTLYFGGGTPSLLSQETLSLIIDFFRKNRWLHPDAEITLEANPEDIDEQKLNGFLEAGINRLSLGIQSFDDDVLKHLGRKHQAEGARQAVHNAVASGFRSISVDLIIGVPKQSDDHVLTSLAYLASSGINHISTYLLTIEPNTHFYRRIAKKAMPPLNDDAQAASYEKVQQQLLSLGYIQYDISSYARPGHFSAHNQLYWAQGSYLGLGPGAHSMRFLSGGLERSANITPLKLWLEKKGQASIYQNDLLGASESFYELVAFGLRNMVRGVDLHHFAHHFDREISSGLLSVVEKFINLGWLEQVATTLRITKAGALFADAIMREILACETR